MRIELPILVQPCPQPDGASFYIVRPLFFDDPQRQHKDLQRAVSLLADALHDHLASLGRQGSHRRLAEYAFSPEVELRWPELRLELRREFVRARVPLVLLHGLSRRLAFSPLVGAVWFEVDHHQTLKQRAAEVLAHHFRRLEKDLDEDELQERLAALNVKKPWISLVDLDVPTRQRLADESRDLFAFLGGPQKVDGAAELQRVGRCQDRLYPDQLLRAPGREPLVEELRRLMAEPDKRPVLVVGPPKVGKTAVIHEFVFGLVAQRRHAFAENNNVWLLSPQRLISGMSYVGQWENRLLAILDEARKRDHVLYFDDFLGMYSAGKTCQSNLSSADVLKPYVERREVRLLAEMTPGQLRVFRERDRGLADLFHLIEVTEPGEAETLRMLIAQTRQLEDRRRVRFAIDVLPTVVDLARRYQPEAAFPGKAAWWLEQLALKFGASDRQAGAAVPQDRVRGTPEVDRAAALDEFHAKSGLEVAFLDAQAKLHRADVVQALGGRIIGQPEAVQAMADVVCVAKARLNDPHKPLAAMLFLGPTGVGKTESAKALAAYLFGEESRLLRFDMNEFISPLSAARLVGTFDQPEGLLTSAVRRQPFCVVLFDEIEKAHPDVFDLMLQILGEARLTDALGRTVDFANAVIVLTSNLGTREAARDVGFAPAEAAADAAYLKAVEQFFRPEFFNRLDRIVPFGRLGRGELKQIARKIVADLVAREGLSRRKCAVDITEDALGWVIERGHDRVLGARAMRRAVDREIVAPLAAQLAAILPDTPSVLHVGRAMEGIRVRVHAFEEAIPRPDADREKWLAATGLLLDRARAAVDRMERLCQAWRPAMELASGKITADQEWYLGVTQYLQDTRALATAIAASLRGPQRGPSPAAIAPRGAGRVVTKLRRGWGRVGRSLLREVGLAQDIHDYLREVVAEGSSRMNRSPDELLDRLATLEMLLPSDRGWLHQRVTVLVRSLDDAWLPRAKLALRLRSRFQFRVGGDFDAGAEDWSFGLHATWLRSPRRESVRDADRAAESLRSEIEAIPGQRQPCWHEELPDHSLREPLAASYALDVLVFEGHRAEDLLRGEEGTRLFADDDGRLQPLQVVVLPLPSGMEAGAAVQACLLEHQRSETPDADASSPLAWRPVIEIGSQRLWIDLRTWLGGEHSRALTGTSLAASLPLPREFQE